MNKSVPRVAAIHDLSGFGRTSLTVVIPILSCMGIQVCPMPTAVLSSHTTEFTDFSFHDLSGQMEDFLAHWRRLNILFDGIYSGFLGSAGQIRTVIETITHCLAPEGLVVVDPVMGDNGVLDPTITPEIVAAMRELVQHAHCITPNFSEAAWLLQESCRNTADIHLAKDWLRRLASLGPRMVVITSVPLSPHCHAVLGYDAQQERFWKIDCAHIPVFYPGTGDSFASVLTGSLLQGDCFPLAMDRAVQFVTLGIRTTFGHTEPTRNGILLERILPSLCSAPTNATYELM